MADQAMGAKAEASGEPARRTTGIELLVFCFLIGPSLATSFFIRGSAQGSFPLVAVSVILRDAALVALIFYFLWRNGESQARIGWTEPHVAQEAVLGLVLFVPFSVIVQFAERGFLAAGLTQPKGPPSFLLPHGTVETALAVLLVTVVAATEETIFRGYLMLRLRQATHSPVAALLIAAAIFSIGHGYEGTAGVATVGVMGILLGLVYLWRGSLIAPIVLHFMQDFLGIVALPELFHH